MWTRTRFSAALVSLSVALLAPAALAQSQTADDPELVAYRERFKQGLDRYAAGDIAQAIQFWEPLYRDLGPEKGYRVAYDLARAYETFGDATRAAERFLVFVAQARARIDKGEALPELVVRELDEATVRLEALQRNRGRISVPATTPATSVAVDASEPRLAGFVAYVAPGPHTVVFDPGSNEVQQRQVAVEAGELVVVTPLAKPRTDPAPIRVLVPARTEVHRPFSATWVFLVGGAALLSTALPIGAYVNANDLHARYSPPHVATPAEQRQYDDARSLAYASISAPAALLVATGVLVGWFFAATRVSVVAAPSEKGAGLSLLGAF